MWSFLKSRSDAPQVTDQRQIDASYKYWRIQLMCTMYIGYAAFYFTRKANFIMPAMLSDLGLTMSDVGILGTLFYITYGCSKFISGMISDRSNPRYFMGLGLIMTGVLNIFFGLSSSLLMLGTLWILNAFFGAGAGRRAQNPHQLVFALRARQLVGDLEHLAQRRRADPAAGGLYLAALQLALRHDHSRHHRRGARPADVLRLRDKPSTTGLPSVGKWRNDAMELVQESEGGAEQPRDHQTLRADQQVHLAVGGLLRAGVHRAHRDQRLGQPLPDAGKGYSLMTANSAISLFEVGGFIGSLVAGWGSDKLFRGNRGPMNLIFAIGIFLSVAALWLMPGVTYLLQACCFFAIGFFIFGPQMLIGMAAAECSHKMRRARRPVSSACSPTGAALSGYPIARVMEIWHWNGFFVVISIAACLSALFLLPFLRAQTPALKTANA